MAEQIQLPDVAYQPKIRNVWAVALLGIITFGIYHIVWYYKVNKEMAELGKARNKTDELGDSPGKSLLAITLGALIIVPAIMSLIGTFKRIQATQRFFNAGEPINGWLGVALLIVISPALYGYMQSGLNASWEVASGRRAAGGPQQGWGGAGAAYPQQGQPGQPGQQYAPGPQ